MSTLSWVDEVLSFWFEELRSQSWFEKNPDLDAQIRQRFLDLHRRLSAAPPSATLGAREALATVIVLDQFPRNMFRNTPQAFATDRQALELSQQAIAKGLDQELPPKQRSFLYMPFQHSESREVQARSVELFTQLGDEVGKRFALEHRDIVERFGRFPHRNSTLGRQSSPEELEFLKTHAGF